MAVALTMWFFAGDIEILVTAKARLLTDHLWLGERL